MVAKEPVEIGSLLYTREGFRDGRPCLAGTGMTIHTVAAHSLMGLTPEEILEQFPHVDLARVHAALAYFFANRIEVIADLDADVVEGERLSKELGPPRPPLA